MGGAAPALFRGSTFSLSSFSTRVVHEGHLSVLLLACLISSSVQFSHVLACLQGANRIVRGSLRQMMQSLSSSASDDISHERRTRLILTLSARGARDTTSGGEQEQAPPETHKHHPGAVSRCHPRDQSATSKTHNASNSVQR